MSSSTWFSISRSLRVRVSSSRRSARVDLPWSIWAMMQKLRIFFIACKDKSFFWFFRQAHVFPAFLCALESKWREFRIFAWKKRFIMTLKAALRSMRLRTLPLSCGGVLLGILLAVADWKVDPWVAVLIVFTTVCLQILSNLSNELGDVLRGTDTEERQGPRYGLNGGEMTRGDMQRLIGLFVGLCVIFGTLMTWKAFGTLFDLTPLLVLLLGAAAIAGAMKYTLGPNPQSPIPMKMISY